MIPLLLIVLVLLTAPRVSERESQNCRMGSWRSLSSLQKQPGKAALHLISSLSVANRLTRELGAAGADSTTSPNRPYPFLGETLTYRVDYLHVPAAEFSMHIDEVEEIRGRLAYHLVVEGRTTSLVAKFFFANNRYESFFDIAEGYSLQFTKAVRQKNVEQDVVITVDPVACVATDGRTRWNVPPRVHDVFSMLYFLRRPRLNAGDEIVFNMDGEGKLCQGMAKVIGRRSLDSPWGRRGAIGVRVQFRDCEQRAVLFPKTDILTNRLMNLQRDLTMWFTDDSFHVPILIEYIGQLASAKARLIHANIPGLEVKPTTLRSR